MCKTPLQLRQTVIFCALAFAAMDSANSQINSTALPTGGTVNAGSASITQNANAMRIQQNTQQAIIDWASYNIGKNASVQYVQPNANASVLNRVANGPSDIAGSLSSNGQVFLLNPNGVLFSSSAQVNVGSLVAAAGTASNASFLAGALQIKSSGKVINQAELNSVAGGSVVLVGSQVHNEGRINAPQGAISLAAGDTVRLNLTSDGLIQAQVSLATAQALVSNSGVLQSDEGNISLSASDAAGSSGGLVINHGIIRASGITQNGGVISLTGGDVQTSGRLDVSAKNADGGTVKVFGDLQNGTVQFDGSIDASSGGAGKGGLVETSAAHVKIASTARVNTLSAQGKTGTWLIDPQDFTIGSKNGDDISGITLSSNLGTGNVSIQSSAGTRAGNGDIFINDPVDWAANTTLTLDAVRDIQFHSGIMASGDSAGIVLKFANNGAGPLGDVYLNGNTIGLPGSAPSLSANGKNFTVINQLGVEGDTSTTTLQGMKNNLTGAYVLGSDIDATSTLGWNGGLGFAPIGTTFSGFFSGLNHTILNLSINRPTQNNVGLFGAVSGELSDLHLVNANVSGSQNVGAVAGQLSGTGEIKMVTATGAISGGFRVGGIAGFVIGGASSLIDEVNFSGSLSGGSAIGGLVGEFNHGNALALTSTNFKNSFYDLDAVLINGLSRVGVGALYHAQYLDWITAGKTLDISNYANNLPLESATGYYLVNSAQGLKDMLGFSANPAHKFRLVANLDLATMPGFYLPFFAGEFDGAGRSIVNLALSANDELGLFGRNTGTIKNLTASQVNISGSNGDRYLGGLVAVNLGNISNSHLTGYISGKNFVGGLVGFNGATGNIIASDANVSVVGAPPLSMVGGFGGLVGSNAGTISDSSVVGDVSGHLNVGGLVGTNNGKITNSYSLANVSGNVTAGITPAGGTNVGGLIGSDTGGSRIGELGVTNSYFDVESVSVNGASKFSTGALYHTQFLDWLAHSKVLNIANYSSSLPLDLSTGYYVVNDMQGMKDFLGFSDKNLKFRLAADIDLASYPGFYIPAFNGEFDGSNHNISNLMLNQPNAAIANGGMFGANAGTIKNLGIVNATVVADTAGALVGANYGAIDNVHASGTVTSTVNFAGGLVGGSIGSIANSFSTVNVSGSGQTGGLVGDFDSGTLSNSHYNIDTVSINGAHRVTAGGIYQAQYLDWLSNNKTLNINNYTANLPLAAASGAYVVTSVQGFKDMLGFTDVASNKFVLGANINLVNDPGLYIPYLVGQLDGAGHIVSNLSLLSPSEAYLGLVGANYGTIRNIGVENVNENGSYSVGGVVGRNQPGAVVESSYSTGTVQAISGGVGGLVGDNRGTVRSSYSSATVVGNRGGGLVGGNNTAEATIDTSFANGVVTAANGGGLVGGGSASQVTNSFWDTQLSGKSTSAGGGTGKTTAELKQASTFTGWDFFNTWRSVETSNVPVLRSLTQGVYNLTVTANNAAIVYGDALPAASSLNANVVGFQNGDTLSSLSGSLSYGGTWLNAVNAGSYSIAPTGLLSTKYDLIYVNGALNVAKVPLLLTADDKSKTFGAADPVLTYSLQGLKSTDTTVAISGLSLSSVTGSLATPGTHTIFATGGTAQNYFINAINGSLTVENAVTPVPSKSVDVIVVNVAAPKSVEASSAVATVGPVVSTQRKALFAPANDAITNNPQIASLKECEDGKYTDCIAKPRKAVAQLQIGDEANVALPTILVKRRLALVIGNNQYPSPLTSLQGAGADAKALTELLQEQGYEVNSLADASRSEMIAGMNKLINESNADDSVFVFYAGHGHIHPGSSVGYWIPTDAHFDDPRGWLSNIDIARFLANISSRQVLLVSDSCFSGALTREAGGGDAGTSLGRNSILSRRSVVAMSSGGEEVVEDVALEGHSPFTYHLLKQLKENKGEIHARTILNNVREKVMQTQTQEPAYGTIVSSGHTKGGEYILNALKE